MKVYYQAGQHNKQDWESHQDSHYLGGDGIEKEIAPLINLLHNRREILC